MEVLGLQDAVRALYQGQWYSAKVVVVLYLSVNHQNTVKVVVTMARHLNTCVVLASVYSVNLVICIMLVLYLLYML